MHTHLIYSLVAIVMCLLTVGVVYLLVGNVTRSVTLGVMAAVIAWIVLMEILGDRIHWGPFCHYPWWILILAILVFVLCWVVLFIQPGQELLAAILIFGFAIIVGFYGLSNIDYGSPGAHESTSPTSTSTSTSTSTTTTVPEATTTTKPARTLSNADIKALVDEAFGRMGFTPGQVKVGPQVDFTNHTPVRGTASFSQVTLKSQADIANFLAGSSPQAIAAKARLQKALAPYPGEYDRALTGQGYIPIQFTVAVQYFGISYFADNQVIDETGARQTPANDILWLYITEKGLIVKGASIRADCGNENFSKIVPVTPSTPPAPSINVPPEKPAPVPAPPSEQARKDCRKKDPDPTTDAKRCDPTGGTSGNISSLDYPSLPPTHAGTVLAGHSTPTTMSSTGATNSQGGTYTNNGNTGSSGSSNNSSDPPPPPAQGTTNPQPHPGPTPLPQGTAPNVCLTNPLDPSCGTGG